MARRAASQNAQRRRHPARPALMRVGTALAVGGLLFAAGIGIGAWLARPHPSGAVAAVPAAVPSARPATATAAAAPPAAGPAVREPQAAAAIPLPRLALPEGLVAPPVPAAALPAAAATIVAGLPAGGASLPADPGLRLPPDVLADPPATDAPATDPPATGRLPAWKRFAAVAEAANGRPMIAIVLDDIGIDKRRGRRAIELPAPVTLAFLPYASELAEQTAQARARGHELLVHVPMQPHGTDADPGPNALDIGLGADEVQRRIEWSLRQFDGFVGINNHMGSRFTESPEGMRLVGESMRRHGLLFLDSLTSGKSVGEPTVRGLGVPTTSRDVFLDNVDTAAEVEIRLGIAERVARETGSAIAIGHPRDATLNVLEAWIPRARAAGFVLVPLTAIVEARASGVVRQARRQ